MQVSIKPDACICWSKASSETANILVSAKSQKWLPCLGQLHVVLCTTRILRKTLAVFLAGLLSAPFSFLLLGVIFPRCLPLSSLCSELLLLQLSEHELTAGSQSVQSTQSAVADHRSQLGTRMGQKTTRESPPVTRHLPASLSYSKQGIRDW